MDYCEPFKGKRITLMGLGVLGRGVGDAEFLSTCGANILVTDKKTAEELADSVTRLKTYPNITFHLGGHDEKDFVHCGGLGCRCSRVHVDRIVREIRHGRRRDGRWCYRYPREIDGRTHDSSHTSARRKESTSRREYSGGVDTCDASGSAKRRCMRPRTRLVATARVR